MPDCRGKNLQSFGRGFDQIWQAVREEREEGTGNSEQITDGREEGTVNSEQRTDNREQITEGREKGGEKDSRVEIQVGILKGLPGAAISRHNEAFGMRYNCKPPYEIEETSSLSADDLRRVKNFAAFWERLVNRGLLALDNEPVFEKFMSLSDALFAHFGKNWGIDKNELLKKVTENLFEKNSHKEH